MLRTEGAIDFDCGMLDFPCKSFEKATTYAGDAVEWLADALLSNSALEADGALWSVATDEAGFWLGFAIAVMFITSVVGITTALVRQRPDLIKRALLGTLLAFPAVMVSYWAVQQGLIVTDLASDMLIERTEPHTIFGLFSDLSGWGVQTVAGTATQVMLGLVFLVLALGLLFIAVALAFRDFVLLLLIAFAPLAFVLIPFDGGLTWVKRWAAIVVAMLLTKPLIIGTLSLVFAGIGELESIASLQSLTLGIGLIITSFMPLMAMSFFNFIGGSDSSDQVASRAAGAAKPAVMSAGSTAGKGTTALVGGTAGLIGGAAGKLGTIFRSGGGSVPPGGIASGGGTPNPGGGGSGGSGSPQVATAAAGQSTGNAGGGTSVQAPSATQPTGGAPAGGQAQVAPSARPGQTPTVPESPSPRHAAPAPTLPQSKDAARPGAGVGARNTFGDKA